MLSVRGMIVIGFRVPKQLKKLLEELADKENRTLTSYIINAVVTYTKERHGIDWHKVKAKPKK